MVTQDDFLRYMGWEFANYATPEERAAYTAYVQGLKDRDEARIAAQQAYDAGIQARIDANLQNQHLLQYDASGRLTDASAAQVTALQNQAYAQAVADTLIELDASQAALQYLQTNQSAIRQELAASGEVLRAAAPVVVVTEASLRADALARETALAQQAAAQQAAAQAAAQQAAALGASITAQLTQLYRSVLGREPDAAGLKFWVDAAVQRGAVDNFILENWNRSAQQELADRRAKQQAAAAVVTQQAATTAIAPPARPGETMPPPVFPVVTPSPAAAPLAPPPAAAPAGGATLALLAAGALLLFGG